MSYSTGWYAAVEVTNLYYGLTVIVQCQDFQSCDPILNFNFQSLPWSCSTGWTWMAGLTPKLNFTPWKSPIHQLGRRARSNPTLWPRGLLSAYPFVVHWIDGSIISSTPHLLREYCYWGVKICNGYTMVLWIKISPLILFFLNLLFRVSVEVRFPVIFVSSLV